MTYVIFHSCGPHHYKVRDRKVNLRVLDPRV